jgi:hypothetical protein
LKKRDLTPNQVTGILGEPVSRSVKGDQAIWYYNVYSDDNTDRYPYTAVFKNGVLTSFVFDTDRNKNDANLFEKRMKSDQTLPPTLFFRTGPNGSPPLQGTGVKNQ